MKMLPIKDSIFFQGCWKPNGEFGECGQSFSTIHIVGGERAKKGEFPYMALIGYKNTAGNGVEVL